MMVLSRQPTRRTRLSGGAAGNFTWLKLTTAAASGTYPFAFAMVFKDGDVPANFATDVSTVQVVVPRRFNSGCVKHGLIAGRVALTQNVERTINIFTGSAASGTALTAADIATAAPTATVQFGAFGTINLSSLLASPIRIFVSGPEMVEAHYFGAVGGGTLLAAWFHVRLFLDGRLWVRACDENGYLDNGAGAAASNANRSYVPTVTIGGVAVYTNSGSSLTHYRNGGWMAEGWIGGDPQITPKHDVAYIRATKQFPNYGWVGPSETTLSGDIATSMPAISGQFAMTQTYTPMGRGDIDPAQGGTGYQTQIGHLAIWDSIYLCSGDSRAWKCALANASHARSYALGWRDATTKRPIKPSAFATWSHEGPGGSGDTQLGVSGQYLWEYNHHGSAGYMAYALTGDYWHYETMLLQASACYLCCSSGAGRGDGLSRHVWQQIRGYAWGLRTLSQLASIYPTGDDVAAEYQTLFSNNIDWLKTFVDDPATKPMGFIFDYSWTGTTGAADECPFAVAYTSPWMHHWMVATLGLASDMEPLADCTNLNAVRDWHYKFPVGLLGGTGAGNYHFSRAGVYHGDFMNAAIAPGDGLLWPDTSPDKLQPDFGSAWIRNWGSVNAETTNTLKDGSYHQSIGYPDRSPGLGYWGIMIPSIALAVDHGAPGAQAAWNRLTGATNWSDNYTGVNGVSGIPAGYGSFYENPTTGIVPRNYTP